MLLVVIFTNSILAIKRPGKEQIAKTREADIFHEPASYVVQEFSDLLYL